MLHVSGLQVVGPQFNLTESAALQVAKLLESEKAKKPDVVALRIGIRGGGCSGLSYFMEFAAAPEVKDKVFEQHGITYYIDPKSFLYLAGTELDFATSVRESGFQFRNPNQKKACGCGESFNV